GRPERAETFFAAARRLEQWGMPEAARPFVDKGVELAGPARLLESGSTYVSVYTGLRQATAVFDRLLAARAEAVKAVGPNRDLSSSIAYALSARLNEMGDLVRLGFSPEEKTGFATFL